MEVEEAASQGLPRELGSLFTHSPFFVSLFEFARKAWGGGRKERKRGAQGPGGRNGGGEAAGYRGRLWRKREEEDGPPQEEKPEGRQKKSSVFSTVPKQLQGCQPGSQLKAPGSRRLHTDSFTPICPGDPLGTITTFGARPGGLGHRVGRSNEHLTN